MSEEDALVADEIAEETPVEADAETDEVIEDSDSEDEVTTEESPESSPDKKQDGFQARIDELTKFRRDEERSHAQTKQELERWRQLAQKPVEPEKPYTPDKSLADFEYDEGKYREYLLEGAQAKAAEAVQQRAREERRGRAFSEFKSRETAFSNTVDNYQQVAHTNPYIQGDLAEAVIGSPMGPELAFYLGLNMDESARLSQMHPLQMAREIGILEVTKLKAPGKHPTPKTPSIPAKLKPVADKIDLDPGEMSQAQFEKWRAKEIAKR